MERILILGGGVGGTLTANLLARKLRKRIDRGEVEVTVVDATGAHVYQPGFMYIAMGGERAEKLEQARACAPRRPRPALHRDRRSHRRDRQDGPHRGRRGPAVRPPRPRHRGPDPARGDRALRRPKRITSTPPRRPRSCARPSTRSRRQDRDRHRRRCRTSARRLRSRSPSSSRPSFVSAACATRRRSHYCSPIGRAFTIEIVSARWRRRSSRRRGSSSTRSSTSRRSMPSARSSSRLEGEELPYDLLILVPPHKGQQFLMDSGLAPAPGGWLPTDRHTLRGGWRDRTSMPWVTLRTCRCRRPARRPTSRPRWSSSGSPPRSRVEPEWQARHLRGQGHVLLRGRRRQGHPPPVRLRPPAEAARSRSQLWHLGQDRLQQDVLAHGAEGSRLTNASPGAGTIGTRARRSCRPRLLRRLFAAAAPRAPSPGALPCADLRGGWAGRSAECVPPRRVTSRGVMSLEVIRDSYDPLRFE